MPSAATPRSRRIPGTSPRLGLGLALPVALAGAALAAGSAARADIEIDGRLPGTTPEVLAGPDFAIPAEKGYRANTALFHSFRVFGLDTGESATFQAPLDGAPIGHVIATVSGDEPSSIRGVLRSQMPGADFYFVNPNGVIFGEGARLDMSGSFTVATADVLLLSDGAEVLPASPEASTLSMAPPEAFGFFDAPAPITVEDAQLGVARGRSLAVLGGDLTFRADGFLSAPGGPIHLARLASAGQVTPSPGGAPGLTVETAAFGTITVEDGFVVSSSGIPPINVDGIGFACVGLGASNCLPASGAGDIFIRGGDLVIDGGDIRAFTVTHTDAGDIDIVLTRDLLVRQGREEQFSGISGGSGLVYNPDFETEDPQVGRFTPLIPEEGARLEIEVVSDDRPKVIAPRLCTPDTCRISYAGQGALGVFSPKIPLGDAGDIRIAARDVRIEDGGRIRTSSLFDGAAGAIEIRATGNVSISGAPERFTGDYDAIRGGLFSNGQGGRDAGRISVEAANLTLSDFGAIVTEARGGTGAGGSVDVTVGTLGIGGNSRIDSSTRGAGPAGDIDVRASQSIAIAGSLSADEFSGITSDSQIEATGAAGDIRLEAPVITLTDGARISTRSVGGAGDAGTVDVRFSDTLFLRDSAIAARAENAFGGSIFVNGGPITVGPGGGLAIDKRDVATSGERLELVRSEISTSVTSGAGEGGNVAIDPRFVLLREGSRITADADQSNAGNILIVAETFLADETSFVRASSNLGIDGVVEIDAPDQSTIQPAPALPADFLDAAELLRERCAARRASAGGSFVVAGRDGVPPSPDDYLPAPLTLEAATRVYAPVAASLLRDAETGETLGIAFGCSG